MNAALLNMNLSTSTTLENGNSLVTTSPSQDHTGESPAPASNRRDSFFDYLVRALAGVAF